jgi:hypothetical protein
MEVGQKMQNRDPEEQQMLLPPGVAILGLALVTLMKVNEQGSQLARSKKRS